jgi:hypothetical protein
MGIRRFKPLVWMLGVLVAIGCCRGWADAPAEIQIIQTGSYHGEEVSAEDGEAWFGLFQTAPGQFSLRRVTLKVTRVHDPITDNEHEQTGKSIEVSGGGAPLFLVKNLPDAEEGSVETFSAEFRPFFATVPDEQDDPFVFTPQTIPVTPDARLLVDSLPVIGGENDYPEGTQKLLLTFVEGENAQMLDIPEIPIRDIHPGVLWSGDLDHDGYADLVLDVSHHYNVQTLVLYLSSQAKPGELLRKVAVWMITGC